MPLAVAVTLATPAALVVALGVERVAVAPEAGGVKVTSTPLTALFSASRTVACRAVPKAVFTVVVCDAPPVARIKAGGPT